MQPLGDTVNNGIFKRLVIENIGKNETGHRRIGFNDGLGLFAKSAPYRVKMNHTRFGMLLLCHFNTHGHLRLAYT